MSDKKETGKETKEKVVDTFNLVKEKAAEIGYVALLLLNPRTYIESHRMYKAFKRNAKIMAYNSYMRQQMEDPHSSYNEEQKAFEAYCNMPEIGYCLSDEDLRDTSLNPSEWQMLIGDKKE
jgi:hypothetical protein